MAVQAQYPSNVLFLNREGKNPLGIGNDYSLLQQPQDGGGGGGLFLDQPHMIFANGGVGNNSRKRGREITTTTTSPINNQFLIQTQPSSSQLIDMTQLHTITQPPPNVVSTGLRLAFDDQLHRQQQQQQTTLSPQSPILLSLLSEDFANQIKQQRNEIEQFIQAQGEQLRRTLAEKRQRHYRALLCAAEESVARRLREKEAEVEKVARRNSELEARAAQLSAEAQVWQARARAQEATAATLQEQLQRTIMGGTGGFCGGAQECSAVGGGGEAEDAESGYIDPDRVVGASGPSCKACRKRVASVLVLPCRHLSLCTECESVSQACPLCLSFKENSIEVFFS